MKLINVYLNNLNTQKIIELNNDQFNDNGMEILYTDGNIIFNERNISKRRFRNDDFEIEYYKDIYCIENASYIVKAYYKSFEENYNGSISIGLGLDSCEVHIKPHYKMSAMKDVNAAICNANDIGDIQNFVPFFTYLVKENNCNFEKESDNNYLFRKTLPKTITKKI